MAASDSVVPGFYSDAAEIPRRKRHAAKGLFRYVVAIAERVADLIACACGVLGAYSLERTLQIAHFVVAVPHEVVAASAFVGILAVILLQGNGDYRAVGNLLRIRETEYAIRIPAQMALLFLPLSFVSGIGISKGVLLVAYPAITVFLVAEKQIAVTILQCLHARGFGTDGVVIYGAGEEAFHLVTTLLSCARFGLQPVAVIANELPADRRLLCALGERRPVLMHSGPITPALLEAYDASRLVVADPKLSTEETAQVTAAAEQAGLRIVALSDIERKWELWAESLDLDKLHFISSDAPAETPMYTVSKRVADLLLSSLLLVLLAPLFLLIALLIRLDSPGPALFVQTRVGKSGSLFNIWKFRSMFADVSKYERSPNTSRDHRITRVGRFLRRTSLDELPQLVNVFLGEMSLVGPRPEMPFIVEKYSPWQRRRLQVLPGITGLWQLSPSRSEPIHQNLHYDLFYIRNRTFFMDTAILLHTAFFAMRGV